METAAGTLFIYKYAELTDSVLLAQSSIGSSLRPVGAHARWIWSADNATNLTLARPFEGTFPLHAHPLVANVELHRAQFMLKYIYAEGQNGMSHRCSANFKLWGCCCPFKGAPSRRHSSWARRLSPRQSSTEMPQSRLPKATCSWRPQGSPALTSRSRR